MGSGEAGAPWTGAQAVRRVPASHAGMAEAAVWSAARAVVKVEVPTDMLGYAVVWEGRGRGWRRGGREAVFWVW